mgnify:CR=1 FL=1
MNIKLKIMKKLMIVAVMAFGTMTAFAQEEETAVEAVATEVQEETAVEEVAAEAMEAQDAFAEIAIEELPSGDTA